MVNQSLNIVDILSIPISHSVSRHDFSVIYKHGRRAEDISVNVHEYACV